MDEKNQGKKRRILPYIFLLVIVVSGLVYNNSLKPVSSQNNEPIDIEIPAGSSSKSIGSLLKEKDLIRNEAIFLLKVKSLDNNKSLKAGNYSLNRSMDLDTVITALVEGGVSGNTLRFTIAEGREVKDIAKQLDDEGLVDKDKFLELTSDKGKFEEEFVFLKDLEDGQSLEGFLFPSTYEVYEDHSEEDIIRKMLIGFSTIYEKDIKENLPSTDFSLNEIITLASIVEREAKLDKERPTISGVFHNRLKTGMRLQSCATVQYILGERKERLTNAETKIQSPFNTYVNAGLPPSPIASPGEKSLLAAINPEDVDYLFFTLTGDDGSHTFTKTYNEHLNAAPKK